MRKDAIHRVSTNGLFVAFFFQIGIILGNARGECSDRYFPPWDYKIY
ncbi:hypothetical protein [Nostoc sp.]